MTYRLLLALSVFFLPMTALAAGGEEYVSPIPGRYEGDNAEVRSIQASEARAYKTYYEQLKHGASSKNLNSILAPSQSRMSQLLNARREREESYTANRAYFSDGRVIPLSQYDPAKDPNTYLSEDDSSKTPASGASRGLAGATAPAFVDMSSGPSASGNIHGPSRPQFILDGSKVPKELDFGKKKKSSN